MYHMTASDGPGLVRIAIQGLAALVASGGGVSPPRVSDRPFHWCQDCQSAWLQQLTFSWGAGHLLFVFGSVEIACHSTVSLSSRSLSSFIIFRALRRVDHA